MRFILALVSLVIAVVMVGLGIAQRTVFAGADDLTAASSTRSDATVTVLDGATLNALPGLQDVEVTGDTIFAAYARTTDVEAWIGDATYNRLGFDDETNQLTSELVTGSETAVPAPAGSDLWLKEYSGEGELRMPVKLGTDLSIILLSDGTAPAPSTVSITWPLDNRTPWAGPLVAGGAALLLLALVFFVWGLIDQRRRRGPRRKSIRAARGTRMPKLPRQRSYRVRKPKAVTQSKGRRSAARMTAALPLALAGLLALTGCSSELWPAASDIPLVSASPSASPSTQLQEPAPAAATVGQVRAIVADVSEVAATADAALDRQGLESRFAGPALDLRAGNYAIRAKDSAYPAAPAIPSESLEVTLPQVSGDTWPRTLFTVVQATGDGTAAPLALTMVQATPRDQYKVFYAVTLEPDAVLPQLAPEAVGALPLGPDSTLLSTAPSALLPAYIDLLNSGEQSASYGLFDVSRDSLIPQLTKGREDRKTSVPDTASIEFANAPGDAETIAISSNETGALVNAYLTESVTVKPIEDGATINPEGAVKTLSGLSGTTKGVTADYGDQLLFYIPPLGSSDKIVLLGFSEGLVSAKEIP